MAMERVWLDWGKPCLPEAAAWLIESAAARRSASCRGSEGQVNSGDAERRPSLSLCDLSSTACVLPGRRAGRVLLGLLIRACRERGLRLIPPRMLTPGDLAELFAKPARAMATPIECTLAWSAALRELDAEAVKALLPHRPADDDEAAWQSLARTAQRLHEELAGHGRSFAEAADQAGRMEMLSEAERWTALEQAHRAYRRVLGKCGLVDAQETWRDLATRRAGEAAPGDDGAGGSPGRRVASSLDLDLVLIGVVELNAVQRLAVSAFGDRAAALVHAPASMSDAFDDFGCVRTEAWSGAEIEIDDEAIHVAERPADQAQRVVRAIAALNGERSAAEITIGLGDAGLSPAIEHAAEWAGLSVRSAVGEAAASTGPSRALALLADWIEDARFATLAALLRHPDVEQWVRRRMQSGSRSRSFTAAHAEIAEEKCNDAGSARSAHSAVNREAAALDGVTRSIEDWITLLDEYFADHLHERLSGAWLGEEKRQARLKAVHDAVQHLAAGLAIDDGDERRRNEGTRRQRGDGKLALGAWMRPILEVLATLHGGLEIEQGEPSRRRTVEACLALRDVAASLAAAPVELQPRVTSAGAIRILLEHAAGEHLAERLEGDQVEMLGWLELHLDPASVLIIAGFNDGAIPQSSHADAFLPDGLRERLGLACNATRYARDAYLLKAILHSRAEVTLIAGRRGMDGEPLTPSRLLLACDDRTLLGRIERFCDEKAAALAQPAMGLAQGLNGESRFKVPPLPAPLPAPAFMRVTDFRLYLSCPYRYALKKLIGLKGFDDSAAELDAMAFGSLAHDVLCAFGRDEAVSGSDDEGKIAAYLVKALAESAERKFGASPSPAVRVQAARLEQRLRAFARKQARLRAEGWRIRHCEHAFKGEIALEIPGEAPMPLWGTIDRIDQHEREGTWRIIDYKTGDSAKPPQESHCGRRTLVGLEELEWRDLQLPLYHYLATRSALGLGGKVELGYICLPKQSEGVEFHAVQWQGEHLEHAWACARRIVREIRECVHHGAFTPKGEVDGADDFARICQATVFSAAGNDANETADERG